MCSCIVATAHNNTSHAPVYMHGAGRAIFGCGIYARNKECMRARCAVLQCGQPENVQYAACAARCLSFVNCGNGSKVYNVKYT